MVVEIVAGAGEKWWLSVEEGRNSDMVVQVAGGNELSWNDFIGVGFYLIYEK